MRLRSFVRRHTLWVGFVAVLTPLAILLALQHRWLVELGEASAIAHQATLDNYLETVTAEVEYAYRKSAERTLNLPSSLFVEERLGKAARYFAKRPVPEARQLFVVSFVEGELTDQIYYYDPATECLSRPEWTDEVRAIYVASSSWATLAHKGGELETVQLVVDERDPEHRILALPITDDASRVVGLAGMILDPAYFEEKLLPKAVDKLLPKFVPESRRGDLVVLAENPAGRRVFSSCEESRSSLAVMDGDGGGQRLEKSFSFVFTDWSVGLLSRQATAAHWARSNFRLNVGLSTALALVLLSGIVLALRMASRAMKLSQMKSDFVSNVSHELRTPLASIRVFGEFFRLGRVDDAAKVREYGEYIETESRRLTQLINNILDFSRIESGARSYRFEPTDLTEVVAETLRTFEVRLKQQGFSITFERPATPLPELEFDPGAVAQSVANLLDNAVKYSDGSREILIRMAREGDRAVISVTDWGVGIPRHEQEKIFERFHRVGTGLVHDVRGSGLGLAIVQHVVQAHGGHISVESRRGQGSTFSIHLPLDGPPEPIAAPSPGVGEPSPAGGSA